MNLDGNRLDILVSNEGTLVTFVAPTAVGQEWLEENIPHAPRIGMTFCVEGRYAEAIVQGAMDDGMLVGA